VREGNTQASFVREPTNHHRDTLYDNIQTSGREVEYERGEAQHGDKSEGNMRRGSIRGWSRRTNIRRGGLEQAY
jgi:hypothetical protein